MRRKKRNSAAWVLLLFFAVILLVAAVLFKTVFVVRYVDVMGQSVLEPNSIIRAANIRYEESIFFVDGESVRRNIESMGTVEVTDVQRKLPSTVEVTVRDRVREAMTIYHSGIAVLDEKGYVIELTDNVDENCVFVEGFKISNCRVGAQLMAGKGQVDAYVALINALDRFNADGFISEIDISRPDAITINTTRNVTVQLGNAENMERKIDMMQAVLNDMLSRNEYGGVVDLSSGTKADYRPRA